MERYGISLQEDRNIIPNDPTTQFICSGMQQLKHKFKSPDYSKLGTVQSCIRTNDLDLVGDGVHLTYFQMIGNFSFGNNDYHLSVELWHEIIQSLNISVDYVTIHPTRDDHKTLWTKLGYETRDDVNNVWSDGEIGGNCCELFVGDLEIGNLVNPLNHSTDVGFGYERLQQVIEHKNRVDETSLFDQSIVSPITRDHIRCLTIMRENGIKPGSKGRDYICRRLVRRILDSEGVGFEDWFVQERNLRDKNMKLAERRYNKFRRMDDEWWWSTFGILPEEMILLRTRLEP